MKMLNGYTLFFALQYAFQTSGKIQFTSEYKGKKVTGSAGDTVTFTWSYSGGVKDITWGIKKDSTTEFITNGVLVARNVQTGSPVPVTVPADYAGRVNASFSGNSSSGQAIFTLTSIRKNDQRFYGCEISPSNGFDTKQFDSVYLIVQGEIQFNSEYKGKNVTGSVGASLAFTWSYSGGVKDINWGIKKDSTTEFITNGVLVARNIQTGSPVPVTVPADYAGRVNASFSGGSSSGQAIFTLTFMKKSDQRFYGCEISPINGFHTKRFDSVYLIVQGPPDINNVSPNQTVNEGDKVTLNCTADGNPTANITWTRVSGNSVVTFPLTIRKQDKGVYRCTANNGIGNPVSRDVFITVQYKPKGATIIISAAQRTALQGQNVTITCHVTEAKPPVSEFKFYFNDTLKIVKNVNHFTMTNVQRSQHYGKYECVARNDVGEGQSGEVFLNINVC